MFFFILTILSLCYIIFIYGMLVTRQNKEYPIYDKPFTVIIPCYNEEPKYLSQCISSIIQADGDKQIILVDNNSNKKETKEAIKFYKNYYGILVLFEKRQGKRFAHSCGLNKSKNDIIIFVDSDTIVNKDAFTELIKPLQDKNIGAVAGQVKLANRTENFLTRCISAMFWTSFNINREATANGGYLQVIAGALGAYKKKYLLALEEEYINQEFLGYKCSISDDRFLTQRIQIRFGKRVAYQNSAISYTYMPKDIIKFWKTLERWRRGATREILLQWKEPKSKAKLLFFDTQFNFFMVTALAIGKIFLILNLILNFSAINFLSTILYFVIFSLLYSSYMIVHNPREVFYKVCYLMLYEFIFIFTYFHAWLNIRKQGTWSTR